MALLFEDILNGSFSIIFVSLSTIVGLLIIKRYFKEKDITVLYMGLAIIFIACPWWPSSTSFLIGLATGGTGLSEPYYILLGNFPVPIFHVLFTASLFELKFRKYKKYALGIIIVIDIIFEIALFTLVWDPALRHTQLGQLVAPSIVDIDFEGMLQIYLTATIVYIVVLGLLIARETMILLDPEIKLKGKFLFASFICFGIGAFIDGMLPLDALIISLSRTSLILAAIFFYFGFILPQWLKDRILK
jgi:hypothetical protein